MFIVLEGTDASGKSSLALEIKKLLDLDELSPAKTIEFHKGRPEELTRRWALTEYAISVEDLDTRGRNIVADRWHWGEITYAPTKRPETNTDGYGLLGVPGWRWVELFLASRGVTQYWVHQPLDVIVSRLSSRGDDFVAASELREILSRYESAATMSSFNAQEVVPPEGLENLSALAAEMIRTASTISDFSKRLAPFPEYIGSAMPRVLLVGDKRNDPSVTCLPFMPVDGNSGDFLMSALPEGLWRDVGIVNAGDIHDARLVELWEVLRRPRIIALGRMAEREIRSCGLHAHGYTALPHPQYVRRFHHKDKFEYGLAIESFALNDMVYSERFAHWELP